MKERKRKVGRPKGSLKPVEKIRIRKSITLDKEAIAILEKEANLQKKPKSQIIDKALIYYSQRSYSLKHKNDAKIKAWAEYCGKSEREVLNNIVDEYFQNIPEIKELLIEQLW